MLKHDWTALKALTHIREKRPIQVIIMVNERRECTVVHFSVLLIGFYIFPPWQFCFCFDSVFNEKVCEFNFKTQFDSFVWLQGFLKMSNKLEKSQNSEKKGNSDNQDIDITRNDRRDNKTLDFERSDVKSNI